MDEVAAILKWLDGLAEEHESHMTKRGQMIERKHHRNACLWIARGIRDKEHLHHG